MEQLWETGQLHIGRDGVAAVRAIPEFYEDRDFEPAWTTQKNFSELLRAVRDSEQDGLVPDDYHLAEILELQQNIAGKESDYPELAANLEILYTDALLRLAYHLTYGKVDPERLDPNWNIYNDLGEFDVTAFVHEVLTSRSLYQYLEEIKPQLPVYRQLKEALANYREIQARGGWESIPEGESLRQDMSGERVRLLRRRLIATGDLESSSPNSTVFDATIVGAVKRFQDRHGLDADGIVGKRTLRAMNMPVAERIDQIRVNLERGRWIFREVTDTFLLVNIASYSVDYLRGGEWIWSARAQVGTTFRQTPVFKSEMKYLVFNPTWTVPPTILKQDILPAAQRDPEYLKKKHINVLDRKGQIVPPEDIDWSQYSTDNFPYILRQEPWSGNALGQVKFIFPNEHFVFLHDTPSKALFARSNRSFSSGCIRVEHPFLLAELLLDDPKKWSLDKIKTVIESGKTRTVHLSEPVAVLLLYWTAYKDAADVLQFREDLYGRDQAIRVDLDAEFRLKERHRRTVTP
jgi:murein L,D-transpeptidase YcbB/YkuD